MRISTITIILFLSILGNSLSYKLRRDLKKLRQYCNEICTECGGKPTLKLDVCVCDSEEGEDSGLQTCLENVRTKFDFLGIKWEKGHALTKRSIYGPNYPSPIDRAIYYKGRRSLVKRSAESQAPTTPNMAHDWRLTSKQLNPKHRHRRSFDGFKLIFDPNGFSNSYTNSGFQAVKKYPVRQEAPFKLLLPGPSSSNHNKKVCFEHLNDSEEKDDLIEFFDDDKELHVADYYEYPTNSEEDNDIERLETSKGKKLTIVSQGPLKKPSMQQTQQMNENDLRSLWASLLPEILNQNLNYPKNYLYNYNALSNLYSNNFGQQQML